ncbi:MAG: SDR family NAD(P)-dependent oxidoreductase [Fibrobacterales bacterium]
MTQRVLVTGASSGVGLATANLLTTQGFEVIGTCRSLERFSTQNSLHSFTMHELDLSSQESIGAFLSSSTVNIATIDIYIANAGIGEVGSVEDTPLKSSRILFEINYFGHVTLIQALLPHWRERRTGTIIALGSLVTRLPFPFKAQYCASKAALTSFLLALDMEVAEFGIRTHVLEPGWIRSEFHNRLAPVINKATPYHTKLGPFLDHKKDQSVKYPDGQNVAKVILNLIDRKPSQIIVTVGPDAKWVKRWMKILPYQVVRWLLLRYISKK